MTPMLFLHWQQYGEVTALLVSKKKNGSAIVEFSLHDAAVCET